MWLPGLSELFYAALCVYEQFLACWFRSSFVLFGCCLVVGTNEIDCMQTRFGNDLLCVEWDIKFYSLPGCKPMEKLNFYTLSNIFMTLRPNFVHTNCIQAVKTFLFFFTNYCVVRQLQHISSEHYAAFWPFFTITHCCCPRGRLLP